MAHVLLAGGAVVGGLYLGRIALRVAQRAATQPAAAGFAKHNQAIQHMGAFDEKVTPHEARLILGLGEDAGTDGIRQAHRALIIQNHGDRGGSPYLARKINEARDVLLGPKH
eukprot:TRINITY_DN6436_c0_g2_i2.p1 TRINITY_DN6436_c0_g2~~TRINITY_DN6436_c0_g2_i2.p1  ORF type:complete len:131 (+),score=30.21 TRINITY_DN6436_c0_g2_i2:60-395(+)